MPKVKKYTVVLTGPEIDQVIAYCQHWENGPMAGWYYGDRRHFEARHQKIRRKLTAAINADQVGDGNGT